MAKTKKTSNLEYRGEGGRIPFIDWTFGGKRYRESLNQWAEEEITTKDRALAVLDAYKVAVREGRLRETLAKSRKTDAQLKATRTVSEVAHEYREVYLPTLAPTMDEAPFLTRFEVFFGTTPIADVTTLDIERYFNGLKQPEKLRPTDKAERVRSIGTQIKHFTRIRHLFNWALDRRVIDSTPFRDVRSGRVLIKKPTGQQPRRCPVTPEQQAEILSELQRTHAPAVAWTVVAIDTGLRRGEQFGRWFRKTRTNGRKRDEFDPISGIRVRDMNFFTGRLTVREEVSKTRKRRVIKIATRRALRALKEACQPGGVARHPDELIFVDFDGKPIKRDTPKHYLQKAAKECKLEVWWHALRRFFGTNALLAGVATPFIQKAYGHASPDMTTWYLDIDDDALDTALDSMAAIVEPAATSAPHEEESVGKTA